MYINRGLTLVAPYKGSEITFSYRNTYTDATGATNYTFNSCDIGVPGANRLVVVGLSIPGTSSAVVSSMLINGVSATLGAAASAATGSSGEMWYAVVPAGNSVTITLNGSAASLGAIIHVWVGYPGSATPVDTGTGVTTSATLVLSDVAKNSGGFTCIVGHNKTSTFTCILTQSGGETVIENYDGAFDGDAHCAMSHTNTATTTLDDYTASWSGTDRGTLVIGTWS